MSLMHTQSRLENTVASLYIATALFSSVVINDLFLASAAVKGLC